MGIVLNVAFGEVHGISIDTHLHRMMNQLGWVKSKTPEQTRKQVEAWPPREYWPEINLIWVGMGQELQTEKPKLINKCLKCSDPAQALRLLRKLGLDVKREAGKAGITLP